MPRPDAADLRDLGGGWDLAPEQQCQLHVLDWLYDRVGGRADQAVDVVPARGNHTCE
jgi:hypothetical protein